MFIPQTLEEQLRWYDIQDLRIDLEEAVKQALKEYKNKNPEYNERNQTNTDRLNISSEIEKKLANVDMHGLDKFIKITPSNKYYELCLFDKEREKEIGGLYVPKPSPYSFFVDYGGIYIEVTSIYYNFENMQNLGRIEKAQKFLNENYNVDMNENGRILISGKGGDGLWIRPDSEQIDEFAELYDEQQREALNDEIAKDYLSFLTREDIEASEEAEKAYAKDLLERGERKVAILFLGREAIKEIESEMKQQEQNLEQNDEKMPQNEHQNKVRKQK